MNTPYCHVVRFDYDSVEVFQNLGELVASFKHNPPMDFFRNCHIEAYYEGGARKELKFQDFLDQGLIKQVDVNREEIEKWVQEFHKYEFGIYQTPEGNTVTGSYSVKATPSQAMVEDEIRRRSHIWV